MYGYGGGEDVTFNICAIQALIEGCTINIYRILPEPSEKKFLGGIISVQKKREEPNIMVAIASQKRVENPERKKKNS
jgi:hypothetical protein